MFFAKLLINKNHLISHGRDVVKQISSIRGKAYKLFTLNMLIMRY